MQQGSRPTKLHFSTSHPLSNFLTYDQLSDAQRAFSLILSTVHEPRSFSEAMQFPHWKHAIQDEIHALEANKTWVITSLPKGHQPIG